MNLTSAASCDLSVSADGRDWSCLDGALGDIACASSPDVTISLSAEFNLRLFD